MFVKLRLKNSILTNETINKIDAEEKFKKTISSQHGLGAAIDLQLYPDLLNIHWNTIHSVNLTIM